MSPFSPPDSRSLAAILEITAQLSSELDPSRLMRAIVTSGAELCGADRGGLFYREESLRRGGQLHSVVVASPSVEETTVRRLPDLFGLPRPHHPLHLANASADPTYSEAAHVMGVDSVLGIPVCDSEGEVMGALLYAHSEAERFDEPAISMAQAMASQAAVALRNAWLHERLRVSERRHSLILGGLDDVVFQTNGGVVSFLTDAWTRHTGQPVADVMGEPLAALFEDRDAVERVLASSHTSPHKPTHLSRVAARTAHRRVLFDVRWQWSADDEDSVIGIMTNVDDAVSLEAERIARRLADQARERTAQAERLKTALLVNLNHEFRTPLSVIMGGADILRDEIDPELAPLAADIGASGRRLHRTLTAVMNLARLEAGDVANHVSRGDLANVLSGLARRHQETAARKGVTLRLDAPPTLVSAFDPELLSQVVDALLDNAVRFTNAGSVVLRLGRRDGKVVVEVEDTGVGMSGEALGSIFDAFEQAHLSGVQRHEGIGIGLAIARRACDVMGGALEIESTPGTGTTARLTLPREASDGNEVAGAKAPTKEPANV